MFVESSPTIFPFAFMLPATVVVPDTFTFCRNVALVFVLIFSVLATPVKDEPSPENDVAVKFPELSTLTLSVVL